MSQYLGSRNDVVLEEFRVRFEVVIAEAGAYLQDAF